MFTFTAFKEGMMPSILPCKLIHVSFFLTCEICLAYKLIHNYFFFYHELEKWRIPLLCRAGLDEVNISPDGRSPI